MHGKNAAAVHPNNRNHLRMRANPFTSQWKLVPPIETHGSRKRKPLRRSHCVFEAGRKYAQRARMDSVCLQLQFVKISAMIRDMFGGES